MPKAMTNIGWPQLKQILTEMVKFMLLYVQYICALGWDDIITKAGSNVHNSKV